MPDQSNRKRATIGPAAATTPREGRVVRPEHTDGVVKPPDALTHQRQEIVQEVAIGFVVLFGYPDAAGYVIENVVEKAEKSHMTFWNDVKLELEKMKN